MEFLVLASDGLWDVVSNQVSFSAPFVYVQRSYHCKPPRARFFLNAADIGYIWFGLHTMDSGQFCMGF